METALPTILTGILIFIGVATAGVGRTITKLKYELDFGEFTEKSTKAQAWEQAHGKIGSAFAKTGLAIIVAGVISLAGGTVFVIIIFGITLLAGTTALAAGMSQGLTHVKENQKTRRR